MPSWPASLFLHHPRQSWSVDATAMGVRPDDLDALDWQRAFAEMEALEGGALANASEGRQVGHYWLRAPHTAPTMGQARAIGETVEAIRGFADDVHSGKIASEDGLPFTDVLHIGIGGSALGPQLLVDALAGDAPPLAVHFLDNTDPDGIARVLASIGPRLRHTLVVWVSKSGTTPEPRNAASLVREALDEAGLESRSRMVAVTCVGSELDRRATAEGWLARFPLWEWVGGRTSVTAAPGLLPAALAGVDTQALLAGARDMDEWTRHADWRDNPAAVLCGCWHLAGEGRGEKAMVVLPYADRLALLGRYLQQLVMESLGKQHDLDGNVVEQGLTVYGNKGSTDQHAYVQQLRDGRNDFFAMLLQVLDDGAGSAREVADGVTAGDYLQGFLLGTRRALREGGRASLTLTVPTVDAYQLGGLVALFERTVGLYASLIRINAYDQPGVEAGKRAASHILALSVALRDALADRPATAESLATPLGADPLEAHYVLEHLVATGRARRIAGDIARYRAADRRGE